MKRIFLLSTLILSFYSEVISQSEELPFAENPQDGFSQKSLLDGYEIGINSQFVIDGIFNQSIRTPIEILIRRQAGQDRAYRLRVSGIMSDSRRHESEYSNKTHQSEIGLAIGYEWQKMISSRWDWYFGLELEGRKSWNNEREEYNVINQYTDENFHVIGVNNRYTDRLSLLPLIGFRFQITSRLFVNTEIKLQAFTEKQHSRSGYDVTSVNAAQEFSESSHEEISIKGNHLNFQPFTGIFINFIL